MIDNKDVKKKAIYMSWNGHGFYALPVMTKIRSPDDASEIGMEEIIHNTELGKEIYEYAKKSVERDKLEDIYNAPVINDLLPVFKNNRIEAISFYKFIVNEVGKSVMITRRVNSLINKGIIDRSYAKVTLCKILKKYKLYLCSVSNWNKQVVI